MFTFFCSVKSSSSGKQDEWLPSAPYLLMRLSTGGLLGRGLLSFREWGTRVPAQVLKVLKRASIDFPQIEMYRNTMVPVPTARGVRRPVLIAHL